MSTWTRIENGRYVSGDFLVEKTAAGWTITKRSTGRKFRGAIPTRVDANRRVAQYLAR